MQAGRVPGQSDILVAWPAEHILVFRPAMKEGSKPSLATTHAKASRRVIADPLAWKATKKEGNGERPVFRVAEKAEAKGTFSRASGDGSYLHSALGKRLKAEVGYDDRKVVGACDRGPSGLERRRQKKEEDRDTSCFLRCGKSGWVCKLAQNDVDASRGRFSTCISYVPRPVDPSQRKFLS